MKKSSHQFYFENIWETLQLVENINPPRKLFWRNIFYIYRYIGFFLPFFGLRFYTFFTIFSKSTRLGVIYFFKNWKSIRFYLGTRFSWIWHFFQKVFVAGLFVYIEFPKRIRFGVLTIFSKSTRLGFICYDHFFKKYTFGIYAFWYFFQKVSVCDFFVLYLFSKKYSFWVIRFFKRIKSKLFVFRKTYTFWKNG